MIRDPSPEGVHRLISLARVPTSRHADEDLLVAVFDVGLEVRPFARALRTWANSMPIRAGRTLAVVMADYLAPEDVDVNARLALWRACHQCWRRGVDVLPNPGCATACDLLQRDPREMRRAQKRERARALRGIR